MATISTLGIGSGLDINGLLNQLMAAEALPIKDLDKKEAQHLAKVAAFNTLGTAVSTFKSAISNLATPTSFRKMTATSADSTLFSASAGTNAVSGAYSVEVKQLAQAQKLLSKAFTATTDVVGTGTLTIQYGTYSGGTFTLNSAKSAQSVTIGAANNTLGGIRDAINGANIGVTASIINDGSGYKLSLTSKDTGTANSLKITVSGDSDSGNNTNDVDLSQLAYDPAGTLGNGKNLSETVAAKDAIVKVDGSGDITKSSNTITDVVQGVTLNLLKASATGVTTTLTVAKDSAAIQSSVNAFVSAYNALNKTVADLIKYDAKTKQAGALQGDSTARSLQSQLRATLSGAITALSGSYKLLSDIGVSFQKDGTLALDTAKLQTAVDAGVDNVAGIFSAMGKTTDALVSYTSATATTKPGTYAINVTTLATQGKNEGAATAALAHTAGTFSTPLVVDADNDTFVLKVDGIQSGTISLTQKSYTTAAALTAEIQSRINGDSALTAAGVSVAVSFNQGTNKLAIQSNRYGSASKVEVVSVDTNTATTLGFSSNAGTDGVDVVGTINGVAASGAGRYLIGATGNDAAGLKVEIAGGSTGARGSVTYTQGYAYQAEKFVGTLIGTNGSIGNRVDGINKTITDIGTQREALQRRLELTEKRYRAQFTAMDTLVAQLKNTSDFLTRQLAGLAKSAES